MDTSVSKGERISDNFKMKYRMLKLIYNTRLDSLNFMQALKILWVNRKKIFMDI